MTCSPNTTRESGAALRPQKNQEICPKRLINHCPRAVFTTIRTPIKTAPSRLSTRVYRARYQPAQKGCDPAPDATNHTARTGLRQRVEAHPIPHLPPCSSELGRVAVQNWVLLYEPSNAAHHG